MNHATYWVTLAIVYGLAAFAIELAFGETPKFAVLIAMGVAAVVLGKA